MKRYIEEFHELVKEPIINCGITIGLVNENDYSLWKITIIGPIDTPYKGGLFIIHAKFPDEYPLKAPEVYFFTPIYHLNVNPRVPRSSEDIPLGHISLSSLSWWKPEYKMSEILVNIFALFYKANPESPYGLNRAEEYRENINVYNEKIRYFVKKYAHPLKQITQYNDRTKDWNFEWKQNN